MKNILLSIIVFLLFHVGCINHAGNSMSEEEKAIRKKVEADYQRPLYHPASTAYYMGDPNGLIQYKGVYHLFYQNAKPTRADGSYETHWGHFSSKDLFHWKEHPVALSPGEIWKHCYSGSSIVFNDKPIAFFTGLNDQYSEVPCIAFPEDDKLSHYTHYEYNPIIPNRPEGLNGAGFRDPYTWVEDGKVFMALSSSIEEGGTILLYSSEDLKSWEYHGIMHHIALNKEKGEHGALFECPSFFPLGNNKYFLSYNNLYNVNGKLAPSRRPIYMIGTYDNYKFQPEFQADLDLFNETWAPQAFIDEKGRQLIFAVSLCKRKQDFGWAGVQTMPRQIVFDSMTNKVRFIPVEEHKALLKNHQQFEDIVVTPAQSNYLPKIKGDVMKLRVEFDPNFTANRFGVILRKSNDDKEYTRIIYDALDKRIISDRRFSQPDGVIDEDFWNYNRKQYGYIDVNDGEPIVMEIFLDRSVIELFVNEGKRAGITTIFSSPESLGVDLFSESGNVKIKSVDIWDIEL